MSLINFKIVNKSFTDHVQLVIRSVADATLTRTVDPDWAPDTYNEAYLENNTFAVCLRPSIPEEV